MWNADNVEFYARNSVPFVVGTTGGDREKLLADAQSAGCYAVIAPQMGKQVCTPHMPRRMATCLTNETPDKGALGVAGFWSLFLGCPMHAQRGCSHISESISGQYICAAQTDTCHVMHCKSVHELAPLLALQV